MTPTKKRAMSDAAVSAKTGRTWREWFTLLDRVGARKMSHRDIAALLGKRHEVPGWWAQMVTVEYERARGLRAVHQTAQGYVASVSRTFDASATKLFRSWTSASARGRWLADARVVITSATPGKYVHMKCGDGTRVDVGFYPKGKTRCQMAVQHSKLSKATDVLAMKEYWSAALERLRTAMA
jgi:hypothetical protein